MVEGFYGRPWTHSARLSMISFLGANGFNIYIYAPKSDQYLRSVWRKAYPPRMKERLRALMGAARESSVDFVFAVSPGLDIEYSSRTDRRVLLRRLRDVTGMQCLWVGIFLDDIEPKLVHASDRHGFRTLGEAHVALVNDVYDELVRDGNRLMFCPTYYANDCLGKTAPENEYLMEIGAGLARRVDVLWTGRKVVSTEISEKDVGEFSRVIRRKPFLWDNYPVNDYYGDRPRLNLGPFEGRAPEILPLLAGYVSNPMNQAEASKIPLLTLSDYLRDPVGYSPQKSLAHAVRRVFPGTHHRVGELLLDCTRAGPFDQCESVELRRVALELMESFEDPRGGERWKAASLIFESKLRALLDLKGELPMGKNEGLLSELEPFTTKVKELAELGIVCLKLARALRDGQRGLVRQLRIEARRMARSVKTNRVQALGEVFFDDSAIEIGLPGTRMESPLLEFCGWSLKASKVQSACSRGAQFRWE